jgi:hypothetical protein
MLGLGLTKSFRERGFPAERLEPGIVGDGRKAKEAALDDPFEDLERRRHLLKMREMPREIE